jgi:hypothetical protein
MCIERGKCAMTFWIYNYNGDHNTEVILSKEGLEGLQMGIEYSGDIFEMAKRLSGLGLSIMIPNNSSTLYVTAYSRFGQR